MAKSLDFGNAGWWSRALGCNHNQSTPPKDGVVQLGKPPYTAPVTKPSSEDDGPNLALVAEAVLITGVLDE